MFSSNISASDEQLNDLNKLADGENNLEKEETVIVDVVGKEIGSILLNVLDGRHAQYKVTVNNAELCFVPNISTQDIMNGNTKKFFNLIPEAHGELYGYKHYQAYLNRYSKRGWLGHTVLTSAASPPDEESTGSLLANCKTLIMHEFLHSRTDSKQLDGFLIDMDTKTVHLVKNIQKFLLDNKLQSDLGAIYDLTSAERYVYLQS
jgi:hypothetical protein